MAFNTVLSLLEEVIQYKEPKQLLGFLACTIFTCLLELFYGWWSGSLSLLSAGYHTGFDCLSMTISLFAIAIAKKNKTNSFGPSSQFSYGLERIEVLAGFTNTISLLFVNLFMFFEALERVLEPTPLEFSSDRILLVAFIGLFVNIIGSLFFYSYRQIYSEQRITAHQENMISLATLFNTDAIGSVVAIISIWLMSWGWLIADPILSIMFLFWSASRVIPTLNRTSRVLVQTSPDTLHSQLFKALREASTIDGVLECRNEHFWTHAPQSFVGSFVVKVKADADEQKILSEVQNLFTPYLSDLTIQIEKDDWILQNEK